jgi:DNA-binding transcriptional LysR family regulator
MKAVTIDQLRVFRQVAEAGSFSAAARAMHRAQSAITYAVQNLEAQVGTELFDRSGYRPVLSEAGRALLPRAQRILEELAAFGSQARGIAGGLEPEVGLVVEAMFSTPILVRVLGEFQRQFPSVQLRVYVESLGATAQAVVEGTADLGIALEFATTVPDLDTIPMGEVELVPVAAPSHPLAKIRGKIQPEAIRDHVQLVLTDRSSLTRGRDYSVFAVKTWRLADLGARHAMLVAGLGWGSMPRHMVADDLETGRLVRLDIRRPDGMTRLPRPGVVLARRKDKVLGPAGEWLAARLLASAAHPEREVPRRHRARKSRR